MKTQLTIDLNSVSYVKFFYVQQDGLALVKLPKLPSVHGMMFNPDEWAWPYMIDYPGETRLERAKRLEILDVWTPVCVYQFRNNHSKTFKGEEAKKKWAVYNKHIYKKK